jgi:hypothetical protein
VIPQLDTVSPVPSTPPSHRLSTADEQLAIEFTWQTDRYAHVVKSVQGQRLHSIEGTPNEDWPLSPAISQLSTETIDERPTVLGVGCSGTTHYSVSVQIEDDETGQPVIRFDWAARLSRPLTAEDAKSAWLGSTYQPSEQHDWKIEPLDSAVMETESSIQPVGRVQVRTVQWSYCIGLEDNAVD